MYLNLPYSNVVITNKDKSLYKDVVLGNGTYGFSFIEDETRDRTRDVIEALTGLSPVFRPKGYVTEPLVADDNLVYIRLQVAGQTSTVFFYVCLN